MVANRCQLGQRHSVEGDRPGSSERVPGNSTSLTGCGTKVAYLSPCDTQLRFANPSTAFSCHTDSTVSVVRVNAIWLSGLTQLVHLQKLCWTLARTGPCLSQSARQCQPAQTAPIASRTSIILIRAVRADYAHPRSAVPGVSPKCQIDALLSIAARPPSSLIDFSPDGCTVLRGCSR